MQDFRIKTGALMLALSMLILAISCGCMDGEVKGGTQSTVDSTIVDDTLAEGGDAEAYEAYGNKVTDTTIVDNTITVDDTTPEDTGAEGEPGAQEAVAQDPAVDKTLKEVKLIIFHSPTCGYCRNELKWLEEEIVPKYPNLVIEKYVASENLELYEQMAAEYNTTTGGVPRTFINGRVYVGFTKTEANLTYVPAYGGYSGNANQIEAAIIEGSK